MGRSLTEIAQIIRDANKKVQLIYAFNGVGKTRLSREFKELIAPKNHDEELENDKIYQTKKKHPFLQDETPEIHVYPIVVNLSHDTIFLRENPT